MGAYWDFRRCCWVDYEPAGERESAAATLPQPRGGEPAYDVPGPA